MAQNDSDKKMWWGIAFGLLFIVTACAAWFVSGGTVDTMSLFILSFIGILMIVMTVVKVRAEPRYFLVIAVLGIGMAVLGVGMVMAGTLGIVTGNLTGEGGSLITGGLIMAFCGGIWLARSKNEKIVDERSQKISTYGTAFSWYVTFMAVVIFYWLDMLGVLEMEVPSLLGGLMFLMIGSALFFQWYYNRRGDVY